MSPTVLPCRPSRSPLFARLRAQSLGPSPGPSVAQRMGIDESSLTRLQRNFLRTWRRHSPEVVLSYWRSPEGFDDEFRPMVALIIAEAREQLDQRSERHAA